MSTETERGMFAVKAGLAQVRFRSLVSARSRGAPRLPRLDGRFRVGKLTGDEGSERLTTAARVARRERRC